MELVVGIVALWALSEIVRMYQSWVAKDVGDHLRRVWCNNRYHLTRVDGDRQGLGQSVKHAFKSSVNLYLIYTDFLLVRRLYDDNSTCRVMVCKHRQAVKLYVLNTRALLCRLATIRCASVGQITNIDNNVCNDEVTLFETRPIDNVHFEAVSYPYNPR